MKIPISLIFWLAKDAEKITHKKRELYSTVQIITGVINKGS